MPAYLADIFGTRYVGAIHGRLLTAWSTAGVIGPVVVNYIREAQVRADVTGSALYDRTLYILAGLLVLGFVANLLVRPLADRWFMPDAKPATAGPARRVAVTVVRDGTPDGALTVPSVLAWAAVGVPILWGVWITLSKAAILFR